MLYLKNNQYNNYDALKSFKQILNQIKTTVQRSNKKAKFLKVVGTQQEETKLYNALALKQ